MDLRTDSARHRSVVIYTSVVEDHEEYTKEFRKQAAGGSGPQRAGFREGYLADIAGAPEENPGYCDE